MDEFITPLLDEVTPANIFLAIVPFANIVMIAILCAFAYNFVRKTIDNLSFKREVRDTQYDKSDWRH